MSIFFIVIPVVLIIGVVFTIRKHAILEKKTHQLMQMNGAEISGIQDIAQLQNIVSPLLEIYINGPDKSMRARHNFSPYRYVKTNDGMLCSVWVQNGTVRNENTLHVVNIVDDQIVSFVRADTYVSANGDLSSLQNVTFPVVARQMNKSN